MRHRRPSQHDACVDRQMRKCDWATDGSTAGKKREFSHPAIDHRNSARGAVLAQWRQTGVPSSSSAIPILRAWINPTGALRDSFGTALGHP